MKKKEIKTKKIEASNNKELRVYWNSATDRGECSSCKKTFKVKIGYCFLDSKGMYVCSKCAKKIDLKAYIRYEALKQEQLEDYIKHRIKTAIDDKKREIKNNKIALVKTIEDTINWYLKEKKVAKADMIGVLELVKQRFFKYNDREIENKNESPYWQE